MLAAVLVVALVDGSVAPGLHAVSILLVLQPLAGVLGSVDVDVSATSVGLVVEPLALVDVAISVDQTATAIRHVVAPVPFVLGAIVPDLDAAALTEALSRPAALVNSSIVELVRTTHDQISAVLGLILFPFEGSHLLLGLACRLVGVVGHVGQLLGVDEAVPLAVATPAVARHVSTAELS